MDSTVGNNVERASAMGTWIVIRLMEKNEQFFDSYPWLLGQAESCLNQSFTYAENGQHRDAIEHVKRFLGKMLAEYPSLIKSDRELLDAIGVLSQHDADFQRARKES